MPRVNLCKLYCASFHSVVSHSVRLDKSLVDEIDVENPIAKALLLMWRFCALLHYKFEIYLVTMIPAWYMCVNFMNFFISTAVGFSCVVNVSTRSANSVCRIYQSYMLNNSLYLVQKYALIFHRHFLLWKANSFLRAEIEKNWALRDR